MAQVPTTEAPTQSISGAPLAINAPASAFAANVVGEGLKQAGVTEQAFSDKLAAHAEQFQAINNRLSADKATMDTVQAVDTYREKYAAENNGLAAYTNLPNAFKDLQAIQDKGAEGLTGPAQADYLQASRRYVAGAQSQLTSLGQTARHKDLVDSNASLISLAQSTAVANIDDPAAVRAAAETIGQRMALMASPQYLGWSPETGAENTQKAVGFIYQSAAKQAIDSGDIPKAQAIYAEHKSQMTADQQNTIAGALKSGASDFVVKGFAEDIFNGRMPVNRTPAVQGAIDAGDSSAATQQLTAHGWTGAQAAGILANGVAESGLNPAPGGSNDGGAAAGAFQWHGARQADFAAWAGRPLAGSTLQQQIDFANYELTQGKYKAVGDQLKSATTPQQAAEIVMRGFERPADQSPGAIAHRAAIAANIAGGGVGERSAPRAQPNIPAPPPITANEDPNQIRADYDTYIQATAFAMFPNEPGMAERAIAAARNQMSIKIQGIATGQLAAYNRLNETLTGGTASGNSISQLSDFKAAYPGSAADLALLPPASVNTLQENINRASQGIGAYKTPEMATNADRLMGLSYSDPAAFADPSKTNLTTEKLSAPDRLNLIRRQGQLTDKLENQAAQTAKLKTLLSDPVVANIAKGVQGDDYNAFMGALQARVEALGHPPTPQETRTLAQTVLSDTHIGNKDYGGIPDADKALINAKYNKAYGRDANTYELNHAYQRGKAYYAQ